MRPALVIVTVLCSLCVRAQHDSLLTVDFNRHVSILKQVTQDYLNKKDSAGYFRKMDEFTAFYNENKRPDLALDVEHMKMWFLLQAGTNNKDAMHALYDNLIKTAESQKNLKAMAMAEFVMGSYYWNHVVNYEVAFEYFYRNYACLEQLDTEEYHEKQHQVYTLGEKYFHFADYTNALFYLKKAIAARNSAEQGFMISVYNTTAMTFGGLNQLDSSDHYFHLALKLAKERKNQGWVGNITGNIGGNYLKRGDIPKAKEWLRQDVTLSLEMNSRGSAAGALMLLASIDFDESLPEKAVEKIDSVQMLMSRDKPLNRLKTLYPLLSKMYAYKGDWHKSSLYLDSALIVRDTLMRRTNATQLLRAQQKNDLQKHRSEMEQLEAQKRIKTLERNAMILGLLIAVIGSLLLFRQKRKTDKARQRSEELLLNILPANVAAELKVNGASKARRFGEVTVLFSDFKDFTRHSETLGPEELVNILDMYFKAFDTIVTKHGLEKIKTVGDAYICVCGLPDPDPDHALKVVSVAQEMQQYMSEHENGWQLRVGIHSGPVVAGIVGIKKFAYDIWGDTVNTAARMEQHSEAGRINISQATYELVKDKIHCEHRGKIEAKNKGAMDMYFVVRRK